MHARLLDGYTRGAEAIKTECVSPPVMLVEPTIIVVELAFDNEARLFVIQRAIIEIGQTKTIWTTLL